MRNFQRAFIFSLATIGGSVVTCPLATGSSIGFRQWLEDEHSALLVLPAGYDPAPVHVPHLTNPALMQPMGGLPETIQPPPEVTSVRPAPEGTTNGPLSSPVSVPSPPSILLLLIGMGYLAKELRTAARDKASRRKASGRKYYTCISVVFGLMMMSYLGRAAERCSRASYSFISLAATRTPLGYSPSMHFTVG